MPFVLVQIAKHATVEIMYPSSHTTSDVGMIISMVSTFD